MNLNIGILGQKLGMTQVFEADGVAVPVTAIEAGPCTVLQVRSAEKDGYAAIQLGYDDKPARNIPDDEMKRAQGAPARYRLKYARTPQPELGHFFKAGETPPKYFVKEIRLSADEASKFQPGQEVKADVFAKGDFVDVVGTSKGRGFTGVIKRHNFTMSGKSHGAHEFTRHAGSVGCRKPQRTRPGQRMAGHYGADRVTVQNLKVFAVLPDQNVILVRGAVPGPNGGYVVLRRALKKVKKPAK
ncbi:MAG TPA: 50S ribosomal protein L3 [Planctomycetota bacterium]|nr:50S ribosomal protein L3 [Planctomycetota bacterium]